MAPPPAVDLLHRRRLRGDRTRGCHRDPETHEQAHGLCRARHFELAENVTDLRAYGGQPGAAGLRDLGRGLPAGKPDSDIRLGLGQAVNLAKPGGQGRVEMHIHHRQQNSVFARRLRTGLQADPGQQQACVAPFLAEASGQENKLVIPVGHGIALHPAIQFGPCRAIEPEIGQGPGRRPVEKGEPGLVDAHDIAIGPQHHGRTRHLAGHDTGRFLSCIGPPHTVENGERPLEMRVDAVGQECVACLLGQAFDIGEPCREKRIIARRIEGGGIGLLDHLFGRIGHVPAARPASAIPSRHPRPLIKRQNFSLVPKIDDARQRQSRQ